MDKFDMMFEMLERIEIKLDKKVDKEQCKNCRLNCQNKKQWTPKMITAIGSFMVGVSTVIAIIMKVVL